MNSNQYEQLNHSKADEMENKEKQGDAKGHVAKIKEQMGELISHLHKDISRVDDPKAKVLFEVSAEAITGLQKAFSDYEEKKEEAWK
jgi:hypothetical protein